MSISDDIKARIRAHHGKRLFNLPTLLPGEMTLRTVIVSEEVRDAVMPPWSENWTGQRHTEFRQKLDSFTEGEWVTVSEDPFGKPPHTDIARVAPVADEIWDIRCISPNSRIRCFGCFGGRDLFIALTWQYRECLDSKQEWEDEIERCKDVWGRLFNPLPRFQGASLDDYISKYTTI